MERECSSVAKQKLAHPFRHFQKKLSPAESVFVEDAAAGMESARVGGFPCIGLGPPAPAGRADLILPGLDSVDLEDVLHRLNISQGAGNND